MGQGVHVYHATCSSSPLPVPSRYVSNYGVPGVVICRIGNEYEWCLIRLPSQTRPRSTNTGYDDSEGCSSCGQAIWKLQHGVWGSMCLTRSEKSWQERRKACEWSRGLTRLDTSTVVRRQCAKSASMWSLASHIRAASMAGQNAIP